MAKNIIYILIAAVVFGGAWYVQDLLAKPSMVPNLTEQHVGTTTSKVEAPQAGNSGDSARQERLKAEALRIVSKPIKFIAQMTEAEKKFAKDKIDADSAMIRDTFDHDAPWLELAAYRRLIGDEAGMLAAYDFLLKIRPDNFVVYHNLGDFYAFTKHDYKKGESYFMNAITVKPTSVQTYIALANLYSIREFGRPDQIYTILIRGIASNPSTPLIPATLATYYRDAGNVVDAIRYFELAYRLDPKNAAIARELDELKSKQ